MVSMLQRMRKLQTQLLNIRLGSGALVLPQEIKRIHLRFAVNGAGGHMGPRKFWRNELIRLKYHNPAVSMTVERMKETLNDNPATMSIHYAPASAIQSSPDSATSSPAPVDSTTTTSTPSNHSPTERVEEINMKHRSSSEILEELVKLTNAYPIEATAEDKEEMRILEEKKARSARDAKLSAEVRAKTKREKELLEQARGDLATQAG